MKRKWIAISVLLFVSWTGISSGQQLSLGLSMVNQTLAGEKLPQIVTQDVSVALTRPDAFADYTAQSHQDEVFRQQVRLGPTILWRGITPFYQLDQFRGQRFSGGGLRMESISGTRWISFYGLWRQDGYGFNAKCTADRGFVTGSLCYSYDKYGDLVVQGPSVKLGVRW